jgi:hypothetical protein
VSVSILVSMRADHSVVVPKLKLLTEHGDPHGCGCPDMLLLFKMSASSGFDVC